MTNFPTHSSRRIDWLIAIVLFIGFSSLYFATVSGITSSNDGSHYALTRTIVENNSFALKSFDDYAEGNDIAIRDNVLYSDRPPGTAVFATLFYHLGNLLPSPATHLPSRHDADNPNLVYVMLMPVLAGTGTLVLLYLWLRRFELPVATALTAVLMFGLGTIHWKYSTVLFSHALSSFLVLLSLFLASQLKANSKWVSYFGLGFVLGYSVLVEYSNGLLVVLVGLFLLWQIRPFTLALFTRTLLPFTLGGLIPAAFLGYYNNSNFGSPTTLSYAYAINYPWAGQFRTTFNFPLVDGLRAMLFFGTGDGQCDPACFNQGFLLLSPIFLLAIVGFVLYYQQERKLFVLTTAVFLIYLILFSKHRTAHGFTADGRYLVPFLSLLTLPLGFAIHWVQQQQAKRPILHSLLAIIMYGLFFLSLRNMLIHIGFSYNYNLDLGLFDRLIARPENWQYWGNQLFRNTANLPLLWLLEGISLAIMFVTIKLKSQGSN